MIEGLHAYEVALMVCGIILFAALTCLLLTHAVRKEPYGRLLYFFVLPALMIGFPGIEKVEFEMGKRLIVTSKARLAQNPADEEARDQLAGAVERVEARAGERHLRPETLTVLAEGNLALGHYDQALEQAGRAADANPHSVRAGRVLEEAGIRKIERLVPPGLEPVEQPEQQQQLSNVIQELTSVGYGPKGELCLKILTDRASAATRAAIRQRLEGVPHCFEETGPIEAL
jgi:hypothetical protein